MAKQLPQEFFARVGVACAGPAQRVAVGLQKIVGGINHPQDRLVDRLVIALEHVETRDEARLCRAKQGKIVKILDLVMAIELAQEEVEARRKPRAEFLGRHARLAKTRGRGL